MPTANSTCVLLPTGLLLLLLLQQVAKFARPDDVVVLAEIPHTATGKVSKLTLRKMFEAFKPRPGAGLSKL
jgi:acyl-coenzyme A synthetase/AMP-(fatty) acid ligase